MSKSIKQTVAKVAVLAGVLASNLVMLGAAQADPFHDRGRGGFHAPAPRYAPQRGYEGRRHGGDGIAKGVAIGVGALILGGILASQANRHRQYDERYVEEAPADDRYQ